MPAHTITPVDGKWCFSLLFLIENEFHVFSISLTRWEPVFRLKQDSSLNFTLSHTPMLTFQTRVQTSVFMRTRKENADCWSGLQTSMIESPVTSWISWISNLSRRSYSCARFLTQLFLWRHSVTARYRSWRTVLTLGRPGTGPKLTSSSL